MNRSRRELGEVYQYHDLVEILCRRADELNVSRETIDEIAGLPDRYSSKLLTRLPARMFGRTSFGAIIGALAVKIIVVEDPEALEKLKPRLAKFKRKQPRAGSRHTDPLIKSARPPTAVSHGAPPIQGGRVADTSNGLPALAAQNLAPI
jgi:hypothetical protein